MKSDPIRVLHLEDSPADAQLIWDILEEDSIDCEIVHATGRASFEAALLGKSFDIILCDNNLRDYSAFSAIEYARVACPLTPLLIISGSIGEEEAVRGLKQGATDYLLKGHLERLGPAVRRALKEAQERRQRKQAEDELRDNEERMRLALAATNDAIWDLDLPSGRMVCNEAFVSTYGIPPRENPRQWLASRVHPEDRERVEASLSQAIAAGVPFWTASFRLQRQDGTWAHVQNRARLARGALERTARVIGAMQDVTARIEAEKQRRALEEQLREAQKIEAVGTLAGGIAHDFNNILGIILANAEVASAEIANGHAQDDEVAECLDEILLAGDRARELVRQILTFSRRTDVQRSLIDPRKVVDECMRLLRSTLPAMVTLNVRLVRSSTSIMADPTQLHQVLVNLCTNSWHALPENGGVITVTVEDVELGPEEVDGGQAIPPGSYVRIMVTDNGHGLPPEVKARIFEPFFTTKPPGKGTGLGLAVVHGIVHAHKGFIRLESTPGSGTSFELLFPASEAAAAPANPTGDATPRAHGERVLLVDDDHAMARATRRVLERTGFRVEVFHAPDAALEALEHDPQRCDILLTDYSMPGMTGTEFLLRAGRLNANLPSVMLSGLAETGLRSRSRPASLRAVLEKPVPPAMLRSTLVQALAAPAREEVQQQLRVLIVDDDRSHLDACSRMLRQDQFEALTAENGMEALRVLEHTEVDLVLTDILMPEKEGIELILALRKHHPGLPVIAMSGGGRVGARDCLDLSRRFGAAQTLSKPFSRDELLTAIRNTLAAVKA